jgi:hypothetical protein
VAQVLINFEWQRDAEGYRLEPNPIEPKPGGGLVYHPLGIRVVSDPNRLRLVRRGGRPILYRPLDRFETLYKIFANDIRTPEDVLTFADKFGPLTIEGLDAEIGEPAYDTIVQAEAMREFLGFAGPDKALLTRGIDSQVNSLGDIDVALVLDPTTTTPKLQLSPSTLLDAIWLQFGQALSGDTSLRQCQHCGAWFETGAGTARRRDAKFCSDDHRVAFNSLKRSKRR